MQEDNCFSVLKLKGCCEFVQIDRNWLGSSWNINSCVCVKETVVNLCEYTGIREHLEYKLICVCVCKRNRPQRKCIKLTHVQLNKLLQKFLGTSSIFEKYFQVQYQSDNHCTHIHSNSSAKIPLHLAKTRSMIPELSTERTIKVFSEVYQRQLLKIFPTKLSY